MNPFRKNTIKTWSLVLLLSGGFFLQAQTQVSREYQIKAVFLFNFSQFVEWPAKTFTGPETPLVIGVLGKNPFGTYLNDAVANEKANNHPLAVQYYTTIEEVKACHILFVNLPETKKQEQALESLKEKSVLTVSDAGGFLKQGGIVRFFTKDDKIQFQINPEAAKAVDLNLSSKLLRLADIFIPKNK